MLAQAIDLVSAFQQRYADQDKVLKTYGTLCYQFPIMVMSSGLVQATAYYRAKQTRQPAYGLFLADIGHMLDGVLAPDAGDWVDQVRQVDAGTYMLATQQVLGACAFFKHLASSLLGVESPTESDEGDENE